MLLHCLLWFFCLFFEITNFTSTAKVLFSLLFAVFSAKQVFNNASPSILPSLVNIINARLSLGVLNAEQYIILNSL